MNRGAEQLPHLKGHDLYSRRYLAGGETYIYAYLDTDRRVLYVGRTCSLRTRNSSHNEISPWYPLATEFRVLWSTKDEGEARAAEIKAIRELAPLFNIQHNSRKVAA